MDLKKFLRPEYILPDMKSESRSTVIAELAGPFLKNYPSFREDQVVRVLEEREKLGSTAVGEGIALPHGKLSGLNACVLSMGRSSRGIDFGGLDGKPCRLFFQLLAPEENTGRQLGILGHLARLVREKEFRRCLLEAKTREELWALLTECSNHCGLHTMPRTDSASTDR